jgi:hypothetical protein
MKQATIIKRLQARALANYNNGWDTFVECYEAADWLAFTTNDDTGEPMTWREALDMAEQCVSIWREREAEAASYSENFLKAEADALADLITADNAKLYALADDKLVFCADISGLRIDSPQVLAIENALIELCEADDGDDWSPREPLQFIPHASDYSRFD